MVLGLFEGELELQMGSLNVSAGQKISGTVRLRLPQPIQARGLRVSFYGEIMKGSGKHRRIEKIFETAANLSGERVYNSSEGASFELQLPSSLQLPKYEGPLAGLVNFVTPKPRGWDVHATLDLPNKLDINKRVAVNVLSFGAGSFPQGSPINASANSLSPGDGYAKKAIQNRAIPPESHQSKTASCAF